MSHVGSYLRRNKTIGNGITLHPAGLYKVGHVSVSYRFQGKGWWERKGREEKCREGKGKEGKGKGGDWGKEQKETKGEKRERATRKKRKGKVGKGKEK